MTTSACNAFFALLCTFAACSSVAHADQLASSGERTSDATATAPPTRVAIALLTDANVDSYVRTYLYEASAATLAGAPFEVLPPNVVVDRLRVHGAGCAHSPECLLALAADLDAPWLVFIEVARGRDSYDVSVRVVRGWFPFDAPPPPVSLHGTETEVARGVQALVRERVLLSPSQSWCTVAVETEPDSEEAPFEPQVLLGGAAWPRMLTRAFLPAGAPYSIVVSAAMRATFNGTLVCAAGRSYRVRVR